MAKSPVEAQADEDARDNTWVMLACFALAVTAFIIGDAVDDWFVLAVGWICGVAQLLFAVMAVRAYRRASRLRRLRVARDRQEPHGSN